MSHDTARQLRDGDNNLIAQFFDELLKKYRPLLGDEHGTYMQDVQAKAALDDIYTRLGDLATEQKAEAVRLLLAAIANRDFATQTTLAEVLAKLSADPATSTKQDALQAELEAVKTELAAMKANQLSGDQKVQLSGSFVLETTHQNAVTGKGNGTIATVAGYGTVLFSVSGAFSATVNFETSDDGSTWRALPVMDESGFRQTTATAAGQFRADVTGCNQVRARVSTYASGSVTVKSRALPICSAGQVSASITGSRIEILRGAKGSPELPGLVPSFWEPRTTDLHGGALEHATAGVFDQTLELYHTCDATFSVSLRLLLVQYDSDSRTGPEILNFSMASGMRVAIAPEKGLGVVDTSTFHIYEVPELRMAYPRFGIYITPGTAPTTGSVYLTVTRRY